MYPYDNALMEKKTMGIHIKRKKICGAKYKKIKRIKQ